MGTEERKLGVEILIKDLEHFGESLWRNEEVGEKRFNFFITLLTAVIAGVIAVQTADPTKIPKDLPAEITTGAAACLLIFGILAFMRMLHRDRISNQYRVTLKYIRRKLRRLCTELEEYSVPVVEKSNRSKWRQGGYTISVGVINCLLFCALLFMLKVPVIVLISAVVLFLCITIWLVNRQTSSNAVDDFFRANVGAMIIDSRKYVLAVERLTPKGSWQLPQGGIELLEEPFEAVYREIKEETAIDASDLLLVKQLEEPLMYLLPAKHRSAKTGRGQVQYWFLLEFRGSDDKIKVKADELRAWKWMPFDELLNIVVEFRRPVYKKLAEQFGEDLTKGERGGR
jgi:putative (di)nucleoside polyphosphate hydrolase